MKIKGSSGVKETLSKGFPFFLKLKENFEVGIPHTPGIASFAVQFHLSYVLLIPEL